jgi:hypothetical protein
MSLRRPSFTEKRRGRLASKAVLDRLEQKSTITEPISITGLMVTSFRGLVELGIMHPKRGQ